MAAEEWGADQTKLGATLNTRAKSGQVKELRSGSVDHANGDVLAVLKD